MKDIQQILPFSILGIDSDNGSEFINYHLQAFCEQHQIQFTRTRRFTCERPLWGWWLFGFLGVPVRRLL